jgi:hypothetical protein
MRILVHIDRLILEGESPGSGARTRLERAVERELTRRFAAAGGPVADLARLSGQRPATAPHRVPWPATSPTGVGGAIGGAIHSVIAGSGRNASSSQPISV